MKNISRLISLFAVVFLLVSCASGPSFNEYSASIPTMETDTGRIYIYRTTSFGAAIQPKIRVNGEVVGNAVPKGFFYIDRPAGNYEISASTEAKRSLTLSIEPGDERYVRLEVKFGLLAGHIKPVLVENSIGKQEITKTKFAEKKAE